MGLRAEKKAESRAAMLRAALELFRRRGVDDVAVREVAARAGVSLKTFYNYFPSKEAVLDEIALEMVEGLNGRMARLRLSKETTFASAAQGLARGELVSRRRKQGHLDRGRRELTC